jgi:hypothetical protein
MGPPEIEVPLLERGIEGDLPVAVKSPLPPFTKGGKNTLKYIEPVEKSRRKGKLCCIARGEMI